ncbi:pilus assembly protein [Nakamurella flavida]|uniref:Pilus assembly protein n=1 Tax=Nakamurella flavida TaxID=363630 RepID=A0A938YGC1_9ACTN|nr:TadE/TadG family type IV pilus assembly protein [Nakamurella flavida]MBM9477170.1 pilus assembly protein [Nakamurella flavida]MDP9780119.1 hypothetical protein [Nakamurella flavida]
MAEFAMVLVMLLLIFLALLSFGLWAYARTVLTSAAADAARYAANADVPDRAATARAHDILGDGPVGGTREELVCSTSADGLLVAVTCTMPAPGIVGLLDGVFPDISATGHSADEGALDPGPAGRR